MLINNIIVNNKSWLGGGISCITSSSPIIINNLIADNYAYACGGIACYEFDSSPIVISPTIINSTIAGNSCSCRGAGISALAWNIPCAPKIINSVIWNNESNKEIYDSHGKVTISYSNIRGGWKGIRNLDTDPLFVQPEAGDYRLQVDSLCIDMGDDSAVDWDYDIDGSPRIAGSAVDIGAYECHIEPEIAITTSSLPVGSCGRAYSAQLEATGGIEPYQWSEPTNNLDKYGLTLNTDGTITGTITCMGIILFTARATDSSSPPKGGNKVLSIAIFDITTTNLPSGVREESYSVQFETVNGTEPYSWSCSGEIPPGLSLDAATGIISGAPTTADTYNFTVDVTDADNNATTKEFSLMIIPENKNWSLEGTASASKDSGNAYKANDGSDSTYWRIHNQYCPGWWQVKLPDAKPISYVKIAFSSYKLAVNFKIQSSDNGTDWTNRKIVAGNSSSTWVAELPEFFASYVKIYITKTYNSGWCQICECELRLKKP